MERDFFSFLALEPGRGLGCGYVGLIVSSWSALTREGWASVARLAAGRVRHWKAIRGSVSGRTGLGVCAALGGVLKGAQIGSCDFGTECPEIPVGCGRIGTGCRMVSLIGSRLDGSRLSFLSSRVCQGGTRFLLPDSLVC